MRRAERRVTAPRRVSARILRSIVYLLHWDRARLADAVKPDRLLVVVVLRAARPGRGRGRRARAGRGAERIHFNWHRYFDGRRRRRRLHHNQRLVHRVAVHHANVRHRVVVRVGHCKSIKKTIHSLKSACLKVDLYRYIMFLFEFVPFALLNTLKCLKFKV